MSEEGKAAPEERVSTAELHQTVEGVLKLMGQDRKCLQLYDTAARIDLGNLIVEFRIPEGHLDTIAAQIKLRRGMMEVETYEFCAQPHNIGGVLRTAVNDLRAWMLSFFLDESASAFARLDWALPRSVGPQDVGLKAKAVIANEHAPSHRHTKLEGPPPSVPSVAGRQVGKTATQMMQTEEGRQALREDPRLKINGEDSDKT